MARYGSWSGGGYYGGFAPYVSVAERKKQAAKKIATLQKKGKSIHPVRIEGRAIARTFWGKAWCDHLENYSDYSNRLPRGRTYVRNGSVIDLQIAEGSVQALVSGSSIYTVKITIHPLEKPRWKVLIEECSGKIDSLVELLQGKFSGGVMEVITHREKGLFPSPKQISLHCSCPDGAVMCKHVAATLYGVGARLDESPELFFRLRGVDHSELITAASRSSVTKRGAKTDKLLESSDLSKLFGIELEGDASSEADPDEGKKSQASRASSVSGSPVRVRSS